MTELRKTALMTVLFIFAASAVVMAAEQKEYVVKKGDTLGEIVFTLRSEGVDVQKLHDWNPSLGTQVQEGQKIVYLLPDSPVRSVSREEIKAESERVIGLIEAKAREEQLASQADRNRILSGLAIGGLVVIGLLVAGIVTKPWKRRVEIVSVPASVPAAKSIPQIPVDPDIPTLKKIFSETGRKRIPFTLTLPARPGLAEGPSFACEAELEPGASKPRVFFPGENRPIGWDERRRHAAMLSQPKVKTIS